MSVPWSRAIVVTPSWEGRDGVSAVTRAYVTALAAWRRDGLGRLDVWSLAGHAHVADGPEGVTVRSARGRRMAFVSYALGERCIDRSTLVIVQHLHLLPATLPLHARGARVMLLLHGIEAWVRLRPLERLACRRAWKRAAVSAYTAKKFREANPDLADLEVDVCAPGLAANSDCAATLTPRPYALIVGRMSAAERYKGHDELLDIWPAVRSAVPGARLVIAGGGDDAARLEDKALRLGLSDAVSFEGIVSDGRLAALYRDAEMFVMPSANEGFGLVYVEAMRAGVPCVVAAGAAEEIVEHERTGLVVAAGDRDALARAVIRLMTQHDDRNRMGEAARRSSSRFSAEAFAARLEALLSDSGVTRGALSKVEGC